MIARVQPLTRTRAVRGPFDYALSPEQAEVTVGSVLRVPFGGRRSLGVVVALAAESELADDRLARPDEVLAASIPAELVALAEWMAREYCSTPARALSLVLAPGTAEGVRARRSLIAELTGAGAQAAHDPDAVLTAGQRELLQKLGELGPSRAAELGTPALRRLQGRGLVALEDRIRPRRPVARPLGTADAVAPMLTEDQTEVLRTILAALPGTGGTTGASPDPLLLHGVTGSGKTEIYLQAVAAALQAGRAAIVLVPEIALTPQVLWRFQARFGDVVAVLHSALGAGERHDEWLRLRDGSARVCVGPRSAVFAPVSDLGLIIVDEEHESSYKHEGDPRYDARGVAAQRARQSGALLLAGSATPRPESMRQMTRLRLRHRVDGRPMPQVQVLDMRGAREPLHPETRMALADLRRAGGKAIVLLNRRGWSNFLSCRSCGKVWFCPDCEVALVLHRQGDFMACHHCGHRAAVPQRCDSCGSVTVAR
ncbi:MAG: primosomal protein N', partial [Solirubrobacteraceae bacterium]